MRAEVLITNKFKFINLSADLKSKNPKLYKKLPNFLIKLLERLIRQDEINLILSKYAESDAREFLTNIFKELNFKVEIIGKENLPENGKCFFVGNHPFGVADGLLITKIVSEKYGELKAIANDAFMLLPQLRSFIAAVDVYTGSSREYIQALDEVFKSETPITHFPAGEVSRWYNKQVQDTFWQKSFISKSIVTQRDIVPIYFHGKNSNLFYFIFRLRKLFGIKLNIELTLLPREFFKKRNSGFTVVIGKPISHKSLNADHSSYEWAQLVREQLYNLKNEIIQK